MLVENISNIKNEKIELNSENLSNRLNITNVSNSVLKIFSYIDKVEINNVNNSTILIGPVKTSIIINMCKECIVSATCRQIRIHDSEKLQIWLSCYTPPLMENCQQITFDLSEKTNSNYYQQYEDHLKRSDINRNEFLSLDRFKVADLSWLRLQPSPNWNLGEIEAGKY